MYLWRQCDQVFIFIYTCALGFASFCFQNNLFLKLLFCELVMANKRMAYSSCAFSECRELPLFYLASVETTSSSGSAQDEAIHLLSANHLRSTPFRGLVPKVGAGPLGSFPIPLPLRVYPAAAE